MKQANLEHLKFKYFSPSSCRQVLGDQTFRYSCLGEFNDPFEGFPVPSSPSKIFDQAMDIKIQELLALDPNADVDYAGFLCHQLIGVQERFETFNALDFLSFFSVSRTPNSILMWSHYAAGHSGFALMLDGTHEFFKAGVSFLPIIYQENRASRLKEDDNLSSYSDYVTHTKAKDWQYEQEERHTMLSDDPSLIKHKSNLKLRKFPIDLIKAVIVGLKPDPTMSEFLDYWCVENKIPMLQAQPHHKSFSMVCVGLSRKTS